MTKDIAGIDDHQQNNKDNVQEQPIDKAQTDQLTSLPTYSKVLFDAKAAKQISFEALGAAIGRNEVAVAAIFYGQTKATEEDIDKLSEELDLVNQFGVDMKSLKAQMYGWPDRGRTTPMPPREPLIYRLYEIVQNYGYAYKAVINEKFGDGIMSAISFSTKVEKETDDKVSKDQFRPELVVKLTPGGDKLTCNTRESG